MSHQPERAEKDCLNCGSLVHGRFCHQCGQENIVTHQNFFSLVQHFIFDLFHFDGKFFDTVRYLLFKPGFVPKEYVAGKRMSYLDPIRMYLFTSALFFLVFFAISKIDLGSQDPTTRALSKAERYEVAAGLNPPKDSFQVHALARVLDTTRLLYIDDARHPDSVVTLHGQKYYLEPDEPVDTSKKEPDEDDSWLERTIESRFTQLEKREDDNAGTTQQLVFDGFMHRLPYLLFVSLPFFALLLKLLYVRRKMFYSDHMVFTLYHYIFSFLMLLFVIGFRKLKALSGWDIFDWINLGLLLYSIIYLYKGMRRFYGQRRARTLGKFVLLNILASFIVILLLFTFLLITAAQL
ncbi:DUF3667 domain-containing protein [Flaviaesturariibacter amylovorans]|uniref:DUF3667 domain-containing protein n=1 Tax=Flaviaesturariibacter amylovorans TaxID=1084520 RepID=A0ABP8H0E8_9BACT